MPFRSIEDPEGRGVLTVALEEYCAENGIAPASEEYHLARELLIILYQTQGYQTVPALKAALVAAILEAR